MLPNGQAFPADVSVKQTGFDSRVRSWDAPIPRPDVDAADVADLLHNLAARALISSCP
jgi:hypothetical protein